VATELVFREVTVLDCDENKATDERFWVLGVVDVSLASSTDSDGFVKSCDERFLKMGNLDGLKVPEALLGVAAVSMVLVVRLVA